MILWLAGTGGELSITTMQALWTRFSIPGRLAEHLRRLEAKGSISIHGDGRIDKRVLRLTEDGNRAAQCGIDPPAAWSRGWDGCWRIVAFDIPESAKALRARLRRRLHEHRFGWLQNSVWISPDPIDDFRAKLDEKNTLPDSLTFLKATTAGGESSAAMVAAAWDFHDLAKRHAAYLDILRLRPGRTRGFDSWFQWLATEQKAWRRIATLDPFLPKELNPPEYAGPSVWKARREAMDDFRSATNKALPT